MEFIKFEDRAGDICAVFYQEPQVHYEYNIFGQAVPVSKHECAFIRSALETRAANLENQGLDASLERRVLSDWPTT